MRVAILHAGRFSTVGHLWDAVKEEMATAGWRDGVNIEYISREANGDLTRLDRLAAELLAEKPDLILAGTRPVAQAVQKRTSTIPIVFMAVPDPVAAGLVDSLAKPGRNATGPAGSFPGLWGKRLQLFGEVISSLRHVAFLYDPSDSMDDTNLPLAQAAAKELALELHLIATKGPEDFRRSFAAMKSAKVGAALIGYGTFSFNHRKLLADVAIEYRVPTSAGTREQVEAGMLMGYAVIVTNMFRAGARYADRILRGARPADLPVEQAAVLELALSLKTAKVLGITLPPSILLRADRVIE